MSLLQATIQRWRLPQHHFRVKLPNSATVDASTRRRLRETHQLDSEACSQTARMCHRLARRDKPHPVVWDGPPRTGARQHLVDHTTVDTTPARQTTRRRASYITSYTTHDIAIGYALRSSFVNSIGFYCSVDYIVMFRLMTHARACGCFGTRVASVHYVVHLPTLRLHTGSRGRRVYREKMLLTRVRNGQAFHQVLSARAHTLIHQSDTHRARHCPLPPLGRDTVSPLPSPHRTPRMISF